MRKKKNQTVFTAVNGSKDLYRITITELKTYFESSYLFNTSARGGCGDDREKYKTKEEAIQRALKKMLGRLPADHKLFKAMEDQTGLWIGEFGCSCHPFSSRSSSDMFHKRLFQLQDKVINRCTKQRGFVWAVLQNGHNSYQIRYDDGSMDKFVHAANLFPL